MLDKELDDDDDSYFAEEIAAERHKELSGALKGIAKSLNKAGQGSEAIVDAIKKQGEVFDKVAAAIQRQPKPEKPEVNITNDNREIIPLLKEIKEGNEKVLRALEARPMVDEFKITQDQWGTTKTVKVIYKTNNK